MIVTQQEAERRGCPLRITRRAVTMDELTAAFAPGQLGNGTIPSVSGFAPCLHERCMAWRWEDPGLDSRRMPDAYRADDKPRGYCGLAGRPLVLL